MWYDRTIVMTPFVVGNMYKASKSSPMWKCWRLNSPVRVGHLSSGQVCQLIEVKTTKTNHGKRYDLKILAGLQLGWICMFERDFPSSWIKELTTATT